MPDQNLDERQGSLQLYLAIRKDCGGAYQEKEYGTCTRKNRC